MEKTLKILIITTSIIAILAVGLSAVFFLQSFSSSSQKSDDIANTEKETEKPSNAQEIKEKLLESYIPPGEPTPKRLSPDLP